VGAAAAAHFDLPLLFELLIDSGRPQVARHALELLAAGVLLLPKERLERAVPDFSLLGSGHLLGDSEASLLAAQQALGTLLPLLLRRGLKLRPLLRGWVRLVLASPSSRSVALLNSVVVDSDGGDAAGNMQCVLSLLLSRHLSAERRTAAHAADEELLKLAQQLCSNALPEVQLRACALLCASAPLMLRSGAEVASSAERAAAVTKRADSETSKALAEGASAEGLARARSLLYLSFVVEQLRRDSLRQKANACADVRALHASAHDLFAVLVAAAETCSNQLDSNQLGSNHASESSGSGLSVWSALSGKAHSALEALNLLVPSGFLGPVTELLGHRDPSMQSAAACLLSAQLSKRSAELKESVPTAQLEQIVRLVCCLSLPGALTAKSQQAALLSLDILTREFGAARPQLFEGALPAVMRILRERPSAATPAALLAASTLVLTLGVRLVPYMPVFVPELLLCVEQAAAEAELSKESSLVCVAWLDGTCPSLLGALPLFLSPYLPRLVRATLRLGVLGCSAPLLSERVTKLFDAIVTALPARQLLPAMVEILGTVGQAGAPSLAQLLHLLKASLRLRPEAEARAHVAHIFSILLFALAFRWRATPHDVGGAGATAIEALASSALATLAVRLNEDSFSDLYARALSWACPATTTTAVAKDDDDADAATRSARSGSGGAARALAFFRIFSGAQVTLRSFFSQYFVLALPHAISLLTPAPAPLASAAGKKRKLSASTSVKSAASTEKPLASTEVALCRAIGRFVEVGFLHSVEVSAAQLRGLEAALLRRLSQPACAPIEEQLLDALAAIVAAIGEEACKPLHYMLCMATRSDDVVERRAAVRALKRLYSTLRDAALMHMPEAVPFISELLEDGEADVRSEAVGLMRELEALNGGDSLLE